MHIDVVACVSETVCARVYVYGSTTYIQNHNIQLIHMHDEMA